MELKPQKDFPYLKEYQDKFPIDEDTVFPYKDDIYSNHILPPDIYVHEVAHLEQQKNIGADEWEKRYLKDDKFRLDQEIQAYRVQLRIVNDYTKDRNKRYQAKVKCAQALASKLYGNIVDYQQALKLLTLN